MTSMEFTLALIKPDAVRAGKAPVRNRARGNARGSPACSNHLVSLSA